MIVQYRIKCPRCLQESIYDFDVEVEKPVTNADRVRAMTDEELAEYILHLDACPPPYYKRCKCPQTECKECWLEWLKQECAE